jgi:hypothetical protein
VIAGGGPGRQTSRRWPGVLPALVASAWLSIVALVLLAPALAHGTKLGDYPGAAQYGLGLVRGVVSNDALTGDQITQTAPWAALNWTLVHAGHLPLWNPYSGLGLPQLFDFQSASFSLPMLVAYLFPLRFAYDVLVFMKFVIAGTGLLFLGRRALGLGWVAATFGATVAELSGSFSGWVGWPMSGVLCWLGWTVAAAILLQRDGYRLRWVVLFAVSMAFAVYGGHPESLVMLGMVVVVVVAVVAGADVARSGWRRACRSLASFVAAAAAGGALSAPLLVPGLILLHHSVHTDRNGYNPLPPHNIINVALSGFYGYPTVGSTYFGNINYFETAAFVGVAAVILAAVGLIVRGRSPEIVGVALACVICVLATFDPWVAHHVSRVPFLKLIVWTRSLIPLGLLLGLLAGVGLDSLLSRRREPWVTRLFAVVAVLASAVLAALALRQIHHNLPGQAGVIRNHAIEWGCGQAVAALVAAAMLLIDQRRRAHRANLEAATPLSLRYGGILVLAASEVAFLLAGTPNLWASSPTGFAPTPAEVTLRQLATGQRVGFAACVSLTAPTTLIRPAPAGVPALGILPETNIAEGVAEFAIYDGIIPSNYFSSYALETHTTPVVPTDGYFCPTMSTATIARHYGVSIVLGTARAGVPAGMVADGTISGERVFKVPGSGIVTIEATGTPADAPSGRSVAVAGEGTSGLHMVTDATTASTLYLHIGNFPGWTATIDGHPLHLRSWATIEMAATVPPGRHVITLKYRPRSFEVGEGLAVLAVVGLVAAGGVGRIRRRRADVDISEPVPPPDEPDQLPSVRAVSAE